MNKHCLARTEIQISALGLGSWPFSSGYDWSNKAVPDVASIVSAAQEHGINWIDTAPVYTGSEELLGKSLKGRRNQFVLASKCGLVKNGSWTDHDLRPATILAQLENSLRMLQTDRIDLYQIHYPDPAVPLLDALAVLERCKEQGKIRAVGVCNVSAAQVKMLPHFVSSVQNEYSLLQAWPGQEVLRACAQGGLSFIGYGTLRGGILSGKYTQSPNLRRADARNYFYKCYRAEAFEKAQRVVARVQKLAQEKQVFPAAIAVAWALQTGASSVLTGAKNVNQLMQNAQGADLNLTPAEITFLEEGVCAK